VSDEALDPLELAARYIEGYGGVIPGANVFAPLISGNNQPCMSGDGRDRMHSHVRRQFDSATRALADAVRSRISNGDVGSVVAEAARQAFDIGWQKQHAQQEIYAVSHEWQRPSVLYRPTLSVDGTAWCALLGDDLQTGVAGFGDTPAEAMAAFDDAFLNQRTPTAIRLAKGAA
jgi:hypothetical protein